MSAPDTDRRTAIRKALLADGYELVRSESSIADPFEWETVARKGNYEITVREKCVS